MHSSAAVQKKKLKSSVNCRTLFVLPKTGHTLPKTEDPTFLLSRYWKRNLVFVWLSQFLAIMGFTFAIPFAPYFIQELGVTDQRDLNLWVALFSGALPLTMAVFSPIWGALADRYGRRIMLLRSYIGGTILVLLMARAQSVEMLIVLRLAQGILTGSMTAAQTMVSTQTPHKRSGTALGALSAAVFSGTMAGSFAGGMFAELFGYRAAFMLSGVFMAAAFFLVLLGVRERFEPLKKLPRTWRSRTTRMRSQLRPAIPLLGLIMILAFVINFEKPWIPLLVQEIHGEVEGAAAWSGFLFGACSIAGFLAGPLLGMLADRIAPARVARYCALGSGISMLPVAFAANFPSLFLFKFGAAFFAGGIDPMMQIWLSRKVPASKRGLVFGWSTTARSIGWLLAPILGWAATTAFGIRGVFAVTALLLLLLYPLIGLGARKMHSPKRRRSQKYRRMPTATKFDPPASLTTP